MLHPHPKSPQMSPKYPKLDLSFNSGFPKIWSPLLGVVLVLSFQYIGEYRRDPDFEKLPNGCPKHP